MRLTDIDNKGYYDVDPKMVPYIKMGRKITAALDPKSGVEWKDDEQWNMAAKLGSDLSSLGSDFGPRSPNDVLKKAGISMAQAKEIFDMVKNVDASKFGPKDPEPDDQIGEGPIWDKVKQGARALIVGKDGARQSPLVQSQSTVKGIFKKLLNRQPLDQNDMAAINALYRKI